ncbi:hypothetical protein PGB90_008138 [Kerria lacca]
MSYHSSSIFGCVIPQLEDRVRNVVVNVVPKLELVLLSRLLTTIESGSVVFADLPSIFICFPSSI